MNGFSRLATVVAAAVFLLPAGLPAQGHQGMKADSMDMSSMQPGPRMLLHQREALELSDEQVRQLEELQARIDELRQEALGLLTEEQRSNARYGMRMMMGGMEGRAGMMGGRAGMMGGMEDMEHAPMMQMMQMMHRQMHTSDCPMAPDTGDEN